ncbi:MAG: helix-turn-helix domain-containing protein [Acidimicrobiia bacterium]|nr:helix-turn-helix domain-containing protein [Acidimicrobiia bacterium]
MTTDLLTTRQVQELFKIDRSTIYRMAEDGRLTALKVGRQWRFPSEQVQALLGATRNTNSTSAPNKPLDSLIPAPTAQAIADLVADLFDVMAVVTDMEGRALTSVANQCGYFSALFDGRPDACAEGWRRLGQEAELRPRFVPSHIGLLCARSFIRMGSTLAGMVIVGGVAPHQWPPTGEELLAIAGQTGTDPDVMREHINEVYWIDRPHQDWILRNLSQVSGLISRLADDHGRLVNKLETIAGLATPTQGE